MSVTIIRFLVVGHGYTGEDRIWASARMHVVFPQGSHVLLQVQCGSVELSEATREGEGMFSNHTYRAACLVVMTFIMTGVLGFVPMTPAHAGSTPPAPTQLDRCGTDQDEYAIPKSSNAYAYGVKGEGRSPGTYKMKGSKEVTIDAYDTYDYHIVQSWTFSYTDAKCTNKQAANKYSMRRGKCRSSGLTDGAGYFLNTKDATNRYVRRVNALATRSDGWSPNSSGVARHVADGKAALLPMKGDYGFLPGSYRVKFYLNGHYNRPVKVVKFWVPACHGEVPPRGDHRHGGH